MLDDFGKFRFPAHLKKNGKFEEKNQREGSLRGLAKLGGYLRV